MEDGGGEAEVHPEEGQLFTNMAFRKWTPKEMSYKNFQTCLSNHWWIYDVMSKLYCFSIKMDN